MQRDAMLSADAERILQQQASSEERRQYADDIIYNDHDLLHLQTQVDRLHDFYLQKSTGPLECSQ